MHRSCFVCSKCNLMLDENNYFTFEEKNFCFKHYSEISTPRKLKDNINNNNNNNDKQLKSQMSSTTPVSINNELTEIKRELLMKNKIRRESKEHEIIELPLVVGNITLKSNQKNELKDETNGKYELKDFKMGNLNNSDKIQIHYTENESFANKSKMTITESPDNHQNGVTKMNEKIEIPIGKLDVNKIDTSNNNQSQNNGENIDGIIDSFFQSANGALMNNKEIKVNEKENSKTNDDNSILNDNNNNNNNNNGSLKDQNIIQNQDNNIIAKNIDNNEQTSDKIHIKGEQENDNNDNTIEVEINNFNGDEKVKQKKLKKVKRIRSKEEEGKKKKRKRSRSRNKEQEQDIILDEKLQEVVKLEKRERKEKRKERREKKEVKEKTSKKVASDSEKPTRRKRSRSHNPKEETDIKDEEVIEISTIKVDNQTNMPSEKNKRAKSAIAVTIPSTPIKKKARSEVGILSRISKSFLKKKDVKLEQIKEDAPYPAGGRPPGLSPRGARSSLPHDYSPRSPTKTSNRAVNNTISPRLLSFTRNKAVRSKSQKDKRENEKDLIGNDHMTILLSEDHLLPSSSNSPKSSPLSSPVQSPSSHSSIQSPHSPHSPHSPLQSPHTLISTPPISAADFSTEHQNGDHFSPPPLLPPIRPSSSVPNHSVSGDDMFIMDFFAHLGEKRKEEGRSTEEELPPLFQKIQRINVEVQKAIELLDKEETTNYKRIFIGVVGLSEEIFEILAYLMNNFPYYISILALFDSSPLFVPKFKELYPEAKILLNIEQFSTVNELNWVIVGNNSKFQGQFILNLLPTLNVFCLNPIFDFREEEFIATVNQIGFLKNNSFATILPLRDTRFYQEIRTILNYKTLGKIISIEVSIMMSPQDGSSIMTSRKRYRDNSGGTIFELANYIDILCWVMNTVPSKVTSFGGLDVFTKENRPNIFNPEYYAPKYKSDNDPFLCEKNIEDNQVILIEFRNKVRCSIHVNLNSAFKQNKIFICGLNGSLKGDYVSGKIKYKSTCHGFPQKEKIIPKCITDLQTESSLTRLFNSILSNSLDYQSGLDSVISAFTSIIIDKSRSDGCINLEPYWQRLSVVNYN